MHSQLIPTQLPDELEIGQTVYIPSFKGPRRNQITETTIRYLNAVVYKEKDQLQALVTSVEVVDIDFNRGDGWRDASTYRPHEVYTTQAAANHALVFHAVTCSDADWQKITGCVKEGGRVEEQMDGMPEAVTIEDCELARCCANISEIRDILVKAWQEGGLYQVDVERLRVLVENHEAPTSINRLRTVLTQIGIVWH